MRTPPEQTAPGSVQLPNYNLVMVMPIAPEWVVDSGGRRSENTVALLTPAERVGELAQEENRIMSRVRSKNVQLSQPSDEQLLEQYRAGSGQAFSELVQRYEHELYNYLRRYLGDASLAEDVFQTTFLQVHLKLDLYQDGRPVRPWLYTIATNQAIDALRKAGRHQPVSLDAQARGPQEQGGTYASLIEGRDMDPLEHLEVAERRQWVRETLESLPEHLRCVVILAYYQGLKYREIAEVVRVPVGTVKSRLHAALARLAEAWKSERKEQTVEY